MYTLSNLEAIHRTIFAKGVKLFDQGDLVAQKLKDYLKRHSSIDNLISKKGLVEILTLNQVKNLMII